MESGQDSTGSTLNEEQPLLPTPTVWSPPRGFFWIQLEQANFEMRIPAIMSNVFLSGFDGTITASTYAVISSEFNAANTASWLTTSYLITSTSFQPLYGRFSDLLGRRACFFTATITFFTGCLGCAVARDIVFLNIMRALTGMGGGGLMTMATIINSDLIPFRNRGMYQSVQNGAYGFGAICGASFGGAIVDTIGWRWCFLVQVPVSLSVLVLGYFALRFPAKNKTSVSGQPGLWHQIDFMGSILLVLALSTQLVGLSLGGNELAWTSIWVILPLVASIVLLAAFVTVEAKTKAIPLIPLKMLHGLQPVSTQIANVCVGMSAYAFLFTLPLLFQVVLLDSPTKAGARLIIPSLMTPVGGVIAGVVMSRWGKLAHLVRIGAALMFIGNFLVTSLHFDDSNWKYFAYIIPANLGQGIVYPGILFTFLSAFDHDGSLPSTFLAWIFQLTPSFPHKTTPSQPRLSI
ncbi:hypothetical protein N7466_010755 [Penicillium verhagenii]|uniref:uncharacterized protein n=1 Tax=Penicillium verhagenii TaxID=1562060 RepID=UPI0025455BB5|nr:uncharacterized protein N7466_010755 [Penicillium verhagenii]KAJ5917201.1 hypothetical protein N7466_010755 [Penicillium verhagenii]